MFYVPFNPQNNHMMFCYSYLHDGRRLELTDFSPERKYGLSYYMANMTLVSIENITCVPFKRTLSGREIKLS